MRRKVKKFVEHDESESPFVTLGRELAEELSVGPLKPGERRPNGFYMVNYWGRRVTKKTVEKILMSAETENELESSAMALGRKLAKELNIRPLKPDERRPKGFYMIDSWGRSVTKKTVQKIPPKD